MPTYQNWLLQDRDAMLARLPLTPDQRQQLKSAYEDARTVNDFIQAMEPYKFSQNYKNKLAGNFQTLSDALDQGTAQNEFEPESAMPAILARPGEALAAVPSGIAEAAGEQVKGALAATGAAFGGVREATRSPEAWSLPTAKESAYRVLSMPFGGPVVGGAMLGLAEKVVPGVVQEFTSGLEQATAPESTWRERISGAAGMVPVVGPVARDIVGGLISPSPKEFGRAGGELALNALEAGAMKVLPKLTSASSAMEAVSSIRQRIAPITPDEAFSKFVKPARARIQRADFKDVMRTAREELKAGEQELGRGIGDDVLDPTTNQIRGAKDYEIILDAQEASQLRKNKLWDAITKYRRRGDRAPGVESDVIADSIAKRMPETFKTAAPTREMRRVARDFDELQNAYRNKEGKYFTAEDIDSQITRVNMELRKYYDMPRGARQLNPQYRLLQAERDALEDAFKSTLDQGGYKEVKDLMRRYGALRQMDDAIEREYGAALRESEYGMGQAVTGVSRVRSLLRGGIDIAYRRSPEAVVSAAGNVLASGTAGEFIGASMSLAKPAQQLKKAMRLSKPASTIMVPPPVAFQPKALLPEQAGAGGPTVIGERQKALEAAAERVRRAATPEEYADATRMLENMQQQYLREGAITDRPMMTSPPADTSFVRGVVEPWSQVEAKTGIPVRLPTGESVVIIGRNPQTGLTRFRYLVPGREGEIGEAYLNLPMPAPRESLVSPIIIPKKR